MYKTFVRTNARVREGYRAGYAISALIGGWSLALVLAVALLPGFPTGRYAQDFTALLDGAYRIDHGQWPHRDFMVPFGGLVLVQAWIALKLNAFAPPFALLQVSSWFLLLPAALPLAIRQHSVRRAVALLAIVGLMALVPYFVEWEPISDFNYNAVYNRTASAALFLLLAWIFTSRKARHDAALVTWLLLLAVSWKISHAVVMLGLLGLAGLVSPVARCIAMAAFVRLAAFLVLLDLATSGIVRAYGRDIAEMARINRGGSVYFLSALAIRNLPALICAALAVFWLVSQRGRAATPPRRIILTRPLALLRGYRRPLWIAATVLAVLATESQGTGNLGLFPVIVLIFGPLGDLVAKVQDKARGSSGGDPVAVALAGALVVTAAYPYAESVLRRATTMAVHHVASMRRETAVDGVVGRALVAGQMSRTADLYTAFWHGPEPIRTIVRDGEAAFSGGLNPTEPAMSLAWAREVAAMANLVRRRHLVQSTMHVTTLGFVEPFGRLLGALPTPGTRLWLDPLRTVGRPTVEEARAYLEKADAVFVQRCPDKEPLRDLIATSFSAVLDREFTRADATPCYEVWLRTSR